MYQIIQVGMNSDLLQRLDELRTAFPASIHRREIIKSLILEAHARLAKKEVRASAERSDYATPPQ